MQNYGAKDVKFICFPIRFSVCFFFFSRSFIFFRGVCIQNRKINELTKKRKNKMRLKYIAATMDYGQSISPRHVQMNLEKP